MDLFDRLASLRRAGLPFGVFLFDADTALGQAEREKSMAESIVAHARDHPEALTMILVGEVHAWKTKGAPWNPDFLPMGWHIAQSGVRVRSLGRATPAGSAWICTGGSAADCGEKETKAMGALPSGRTSGIEALPEPSSHGYDGMYATPTLTVSPPAKASLPGTAPSAPPR